MLISLPFGFPCKLFLGTEEVRLASSVHLPSTLTSSYISFAFNLFESLLNLSPETLCKVQFPRISFKEAHLWVEKEHVWIEEEDEKKEKVLAQVIISPRNEKGIEEAVDEVLMRANYGEYANYVRQNKPLPNPEPFIPLFESFKANLKSLWNAFDKARRKEKPLLWFHITKSGIVLFHLSTNRYDPLPNWDIKDKLITLNLEIILTRKENALHTFNLVEKEVLCLPEVYNSPKKRTQAYKNLIIPITLKLYRIGLPDTKAQLEQLIKDEVFKLLNPPKRIKRSQNTTHFTDARSETKHVCSICGKSHDVKSRMCSTCKADLSYLRDILSELKLPEDVKQAFLNQKLTQDELHNLWETLKAKGKTELAYRLKGLYEKVPKFRKYVENY